MVGGKIKEYVGMSKLTTYLGKNVNFILHVWCKSNIYSVYIILWDAHDTCIQWFHHMLDSWIPVTYDIKKE